MFRCLLFDYRHYGGGLPDLTLVRATMSDSAAGGDTVLVDLEDWIGEGTFSNAMDETKPFEDDEFLGCTKTGDTGSSSRPSGRSKRPRQWQTGNGDDGQASSSSKPMEVSTARSGSAVPERLQLVRENGPVLVECVMVEVKSSNDRLDPRQEDWLNIIDRHGQARVCKFTAAAPIAKSSEST
jgi:hypothetical protein